MYHVFQYIKFQTRVIFVASTGKVIMVIKMEGPGQDSETILENDTALITFS